MKLQWRSIVWVDLGLVAAYMGLIFFLSSKPQVMSFQMPINHFDKVIHFCAFAVLGVLLCRLGYHLTGSYFWGVWVGFVLGSLYGITDELHQAHVPGRHSDIYDIYADISGSLVGSLCWAWWLQWRSRLDKEQGKQNEPTF